MRIIDADELKELRELYIQGKLQFIGNEYDLIDKCPTIDAEPVRHGQWKYTLYDRVGTLTTDGDLTCMDCGGRFFRVIGTWYKYCPNCGAKMDLEE